MKKYSYLLVLLAGCGFLSSCQEDLDPTQPTSIATIQVTTTGFEPKDPNSRTNDVGYTTTFTNGDAIGISVVDANSNMVQDNLKYVHNGTTFAPVSTPVNIYPNATYIAYYPYDAAMTGKKTTAEIFDAFTPKTDQSTYADYTASDLMVAEGVVANNTINFTLTHMLSLITITLADQTYKIGNNSSSTFTKPSTWGSLSIGSSTGLKPYIDGDKQYRYITKPATNVVVEGTFTPATDNLITYSPQPFMLEAGKYYHINATYDGATTAIDTNPVTIDVGIDDPTPASGTVWSFANGIYTLTGDATLTGTTTANSVEVTSGTTANVTLDNVDIQLADKTPITVNGATVTLNLSGTNTLKITGQGQTAAAVRSAVIRVPEGSTLIIDSASEANSLTISGFMDGAGIGGEVYENGGNITINGGTVTVTGGGDPGAAAAGIGGGHSASGGTFTMNGGTLTVTGVANGAGIGGGGWGSPAGGTIAILGGTVTATGYVAIGHGATTGHHEPAILTLPATTYKWWHGVDAASAVPGTVAEVDNIQTYKYVKIEVD